MSEAGQRIRRAKFITVTATRVLMQTEQNIIRSKLKMNAFLIVTLIIQEITFNNRIFTYNFLKVILELWYLIKHYSGN